MTFKDQASAGWKWQNYSIYIQL